MKLYLDSSAVVKLVEQETESAALREFLRRHHDDGLMTSALTRMETLRAVAPGGDLALALARRQLARLDVVRLGDAVLDRASRLGPPVLRTLDAIHLASAEQAGTALRSIVTYDRRMVDAAQALGLPTEMPA